MFLDNPTTAGIKGPSSNASRCYGNASKKMAATEEAKRPLATLSWRLKAAALQYSGCRERGKKKT